MNCIRLIVAQFPSCTRSFGGIGSTVTYTDSYEFATAQVDSTTTTSVYGAGLMLNVQVIAGSVGFALGTQIGYEREEEQSRSEEKDTADVRTRSFTLGDPDYGDYFDVQVRYELVGCSSHYLT